MAGEAQISCWQPILAAKNEQTGLLNEESIQKMGSRLQVTVRDRVKVFKLQRPDNGIFSNKKSNKQKNKTKISQDPNVTQNKIEAPLVGELLGTEMLLTPDQSVQTTFECATTAKQKDSFGKETICLKKSLKYVQSGTIVIHCQSKSFDRSFSRNDNIRHRRILGIYKSFARTDYLELQYLIKKSKERRAPTNVMLEVVNASFGDKTFFSEISGQVRQYDPNILQKIFSELKEQEFKQQDDVYGEQMPHPILRRLNFSLLANCMVTLRRQRGQPIDIVMTNNLPMPNKTEQALGMAITDKLIQLGKLSPEFSIFESIGSQDEFEILLQHSTPNVLAALNHGRFAPTTTQKIEKLQWPTKRKYLGCLRFAMSQSVLTYETKHHDLQKKSFEE